jgi:putative hydroxymethylpyrimidine transport system substrate-binding protein
MKFKKRLMIIALIVCTMSSSVMAKNKKVTLMLDWFVNPNHGPIVIAQLRGYFKAQGLDVDIQQPEDPSIPAKLVAEGKIDLAVSYQPSLIMDVANGLPLIRTATLIATPLNTLIVLDNKQIKGLTDLKGKKIGVSIVGSEQLTLGAMLKSHNVQLKDVEIVNVAMQLKSSLASGEVDAIWGGFRNFEATQFALEGIQIKEFFPEEHGVPVYDELVFIANADSYDKNVIIAFNRALEQAANYIINHQDEAWKEFVTYSPSTLNNQLNKRAWNDTVIRFALRPAAVDLQRYNDYANFMLEHHIINAIPNVETYVPTLYR